MCNSVNIVPAYEEWRLFSIAKMQEDTRTLLGSLWIHHPATTWFISFIKSRGNRKPVGHAQPFKNKSRFFVLILTKVRDTSSFKSFEYNIRAMINADILISHLSAGYSQIHAFMISQMAQRDVISLSN